MNSWYTIQVQFSMFQFNFAIFIMVSSILRACCAIIDGFFPLEIIFHFDFRFFSLNIASNFGRRFSKRMIMDLIMWDVASQSRSSFTSCLFHSESSTNSLILSCRTEISSFSTGIYLRLEESSLSWSRECSRSSVERHMHSRISANKLWRLSILFS